MEHQKLFRYCLAPAILLTLQTQVSARQDPGGGVTAQTVTADQTRVLTSLHEDEKTARVVYRFLYDRWGLNALDRIAVAEQTHLDDIGNLQARYHIDDPAAWQTPGALYQRNRHKPYAKLTAKGGLTVTDALEVSSLIEQTDITDIEKALPSITNLDSKRVLKNSFLGSDSHLELCSNSAWKCRV